MKDPGSNQLMAMHDLLASRQDEILGSIRKLVETESPSGDFEGSRAVVDLLVETARTIPAISSVERIPIPGYGEHLLVQAFGGPTEDSGKTLLLGHTDTVHPRSTLDAQGVRAEGGRLYGPGVFDMKASCVLALEALRTLGDLDFIPKRAVELLLTCDIRSCSPRRAVGGTHRLTLEEGMNVRRSIRIADEVRRFMTRARPSTYEHGSPKGFKMQCSLTTS